MSESGLARAGFFMILSTINIKPASASEAGFIFIVESIG